MESHRIEAHWARWLVGMLLLALSIDGSWVAVRAQGPVHVTVNEMSTSGFPDVVAYVTVSDARGHPVVELPPESFVLSEDGTPLREVQVSLLENVGEPILLVVALDTSGSVAGQALADSKAAASYLIRSLGPADQVAVISFDNDAITQLELTADKDAAVAAVGALNAQRGGYTTLNKGIRQGVQLLASRPRGRKALVVLTDGKDTAGAPTIDDAIGAAQQAGVPVYAVGFGPEIQPAVLERLATLTGGHFYQSPSSAEIGDSFEAVAKLLRYQYVLSFSSSLRADDGPHTLRVTVDVKGVQSSTEASFKAERRAIVVKMLAPASGERVGGSVVLKPSIEAPGSVTRVEYLLDGAPLATVTTGEFAYEWDTLAVPLGSHTLTVRVADSAGNEGQTSLTLAVVRPIEVAFSVPVELQPVTGTVAVETTVSAVRGIARVEFAVDDKIVATATSAPWRCTWDTARERPGPHKLTATVYDVAGHSTQATREVWVGVRVEMPTLHEGDRVGGNVALVPRVDAPAEVVKVEYLLDGAPLATAAAGEYSFEWDTLAVQLGEHSLTVRATDSAGTQGQLDITLTVVRPIAVSFVAPPESEREQLRDQVVVKAEVVALREVTRVEFAVDGQALATVESLPWEFTWDTRKWATGRHTLAATAYDVAGQSSQATLDVWVEMRGRQWAFWVVLAVLLLAGGVVVPLALRRRRRMAAQPVAGAKSVPLSGTIAEVPRVTKQGVVAWLVVERGSEIGRRWPVGLGETSLGRSRADNDIVIPSPTASRRHAVIRAGADSCVYYDLEPTHPTLINGEPIAGYHALAEGDRIQIGEDTILEFNKEGLE